MPFGTRRLTDPITQNCFAGLAEEGGKSRQRGFLTITELTQFNALCEHRISLTNI